MVIDLTDDACEQIKEMLKDETEEAHLRFGVKGGGCSGLSYELGFEYDINDEIDKVFNIKEIPIVILNQDVHILEYMIIEFMKNIYNISYCIYYYVSVVIKSS